MPDNVELEDGRPANVTVTNPAAAEQHYQQVREALDEAAVLQYEQLGHLENPEPEPEEIINGIPIPAVTPQEPEILTQLREVDSDDPNTNYQRGGKSYVAINQKNPRCVTPEMRANAIVEAQNTQPVPPVYRQQETVNPNVQKAVDSMVAMARQGVPVTPNGATLMDIANHIQTLLQGQYKIVGFEEKDGRLHMVVE